MKQADLLVCAQSRLFAGIDLNDIDELLTISHAKVREFAPDEFILLAGIDKPRMGIIISGMAIIEQPSISGASSMIERVESSDTYAEVLNCLELETSPVSVRALTPLRVVTFDIQKIIRTIDHRPQLSMSLARASSLVAKNAISTMAQKTKVLRDRVEVLSRRTTQEKLAAYLEQQARRQMMRDHVEDYPRVIELSLTRTELAEMLCVNRSALSREMSRLRDMGYLDFHGNAIHVIDWVGLQGG